MGVSYILTDYAVSVRLGVTQFKGKVGAASGGAAIEFPQKSTIQSR
jgi:hypothetical protein